MNLRALHATPSHSQVPMPLPKSTALPPSDAILMSVKDAPVGGKTDLGSQDSPFHSHVSATGLPSTLGGPAAPRAPPVPPAASDPSSLCRPGAPAEPAAAPAAPAAPLGPAAPIPALPPAPVGGGPA